MSTNKELIIKSANKVISDGDYNLNDRALSYEYMKIMIEKDFSEEKFLQTVMISNRDGSENLSLLCKLLSTLLHNIEQSDELRKIVDIGLKMIETQQGIIQSEYVVDRLTGLLNYNYLALVKNKIKNEEYLLFFFDIDNLKQANDQYGHEYGNELITTFADALKECFRVNDYLFRYGGDEFIAIILRPQIKGGSINARLKQKLKNTDVNYSVGWAYNTNKSFSDTLKLADKRMYDNKRENRQCRNSKN